MEHNESDDARHRGRWAVVVEPGSTGRVWPAARLCTPLTYKVTAIWWPDGWEPDSPLDVPNCVWQAEGQRRRPMAQLSPGGSHGVGPESAVHGPAGHDLARDRGGRE